VIVIAGIGFVNYALIRDATYGMHPHFPPSCAQCLRYLHFVHAWQGSEPVHVDANSYN
jgi:hypothetical protein